MKHSQVVDNMLNVKGERSVSLLLVFYTNFYLALKQAMFSVGIITWAGADKEFMCRNYSGLYGFVTN